MRSEIKIGMVVITTFISLVSFCLSAATIAGHVTDEKNEAVPFASVYIKGTTRGTTTNTNGNYSIDLEPGKYELVFKLIGYKQQIEKLEVASEKILLNVKLLPEDVQLKEVGIKADGEDPAYEVIRQAIKKRKFYLNQVKSYSCDVYIKGLQRVTKAPKKVLGIEVDFEGERDSTSGIVYLSESVSKFNFLQPDKIKEEMISSKVSGDNKAFSYNQASDMLFNFYENVVSVESLSDRGFISPISNNAFLTYKYKLLGTVFENGQMINKIEVIPKRKTDPAFRGIIYIMENSWRIHSTDLYLTKDAKIDFVDTLVVRQTHLPVEKDIWMPFSNRFTFTFSVLGFKGNGGYVGVNSNYVIEPDFPKKFFSNEVLKITDGANKKDTAYWKTARPVPLTAEEEKDYRRRDSLQKIRESKPFQDSLDKKRNKFHFSNSILGYTYNDRFHKRSFSFSPLFNNVQFNTVQGWNASLTFTFMKWHEERRHNMSLSTELGYGFSNERGYGNVKLRYRYKPERFANFTLTGGRSVEQYNRKEENSSIANIIYSSYALFDKQNLLKFYEKDFINALHSMEVVNGIVLYTSAEYAYRRPMINTTSYSVVNKPELDYTSNNPFDPYHNTTAFVSNGTLEVEVGLRIRFAQKYYTRPHEKVIVGSKYPTFTVNYHKAVAGLFGTTTNYDLAKISMTDEMNLKLIGITRYSITAGKFFNRANLSLPDYYHINTTPTVFSTFTINSFTLPGFYDYSTNDQFLEGHVEHNFGGFIINKLPLLRKLKLQEVVAFNFLTNDRVHQYSELVFGLKTLGFRIDFATGYSNSNKVSAGFRVGIVF